jgi:acetoacetyl-CoA synthetase
VAEPGHLPHLARFMDRARLRYGADCNDYAGLHRWSVENPATFWAAVASFCDLRFRRDADRVVENSEQMPGARWFVGAELNFAENLLRWRDERPALIWRDESGRRRELSHAQLAVEVSRAAAGFRRLGLSRGDRVAAFVPNCIEAVVGMLAAASLGAIWTSSSPDFGAAGAHDRFAQVTPKLLLAVDGYCYAGKRIDVWPVVAELASGIPGLNAVIVIPYLATAVDGAAAAAPDIATIPNAISWQALTAVAEPLEFVATPFDHPLYILYSSGTTGAPKCIVHGAGGTLLQHLKEHLLHTDLRRSDRLFWYTTCGWMMWNWLISGLASGATLLLYDGSPAWPDAAALWRIAAEEGVTVFGTSAKYLAGNAKAGLHPGRDFDLHRLRAVLSTGSPLAPESFDYIYARVKPNVHIASISGGTDIISCFMLGNPLLPVQRGELQCAGLGMAVEICDEQGHVLTEGTGELICERPFPSMPLGFWDDADGRLYHAAYFERFPGVWAHGDHAERTPSGGFIIHGRSDAVLNPGGVRIGSAELYRAVEAVPEVLESLAVGERAEGDEHIVLFVVLRAGLTLDAALCGKIRLAVRQTLTPRHVPAKILQARDLPRTRSGKLAELAVRAILHGEAVANLAALSNPEALEQIRRSFEAGRT